MHRSHVDGVIPRQRIVDLDLLVAFDDGPERKGAAIVKANRDLAAARALVPPGLYWLGFDIGKGIFGDPAQGAQKNTLMGPGSEKIWASLAANG